MPATKEQRDLLFQKMKETGYEWDAEKKELKKIEQKPINSQFTPEQSSVLDKHIDKFLEQKSAWSEEDEEMIKGLNNCLSELEEKNGWRYTYVNNKDVELDKIRNWLQSIKERCAWKPSDEQMDAVKSAALDVAKFSSRSEQLRLENELYYKALISLNNDLKKLREE